MAVLPIITIPDAVLRKNAAQIERVDTSFRLITQLAPA